MANKGIDFNPGSHPYPDDRNRSILWARYKMEDAESSQNGAQWCILSFKMTPTDVAQPLCSFAVIDPQGKIVMESLIKTNYIVANESIAEHGLDFSVALKPKAYRECRKDLIEYLRGKEVIVWDLKETWSLFNQLDALYGDVPTDSVAQVARTWTWHDVAEEYARFVGELVSGGNQDAPRTYSPEPYKPLPGLSAVQECKDIRDIIVKMAGTSLVTDPLASGKKGWTAEFYRPNVGPTEKLKKFFEF